MKRVAIPIHDGKLSEYFGRCSYYEIFDIDGKSINKSQLALPDINDVSRMPEWASRMGITDIITYKIDKSIIMLFNKLKINLFVGIDIDTSENIIKEFLNEQLTSSQKIIGEIINN